LRERFLERFTALGVKFSVDPDGAVRVPARHASVGALIASFENDEISVFIGEITHCHFTPGACGDIDSTDPVGECVAEATRYLREVFADRYIFWSAGHVGGSYHIDHPVDTPPARAQRFLWSGPITE